MQWVCYAYAIAEFFPTLLGRVVCFLLIPSSSLHPPPPLPPPPAQHLPRPPPRKRPCLDTSAFLASIPLPFAAR